MTFCRTKAHRCCRPGSAKSPLSTPARCRSSTLASVGAITGSRGLLSPDRCRPFDRRRRGISIGEGAGFALLERAGQSDALLLLGAGEASDAHHMSTPHPDGIGAELAMQGALRTASLVPKQI